MRAVSTAPAGVVSADTILTFEQRADVVSARYRGGEIVEGYLLGRLFEHEPYLRFCYVQTDLKGRIDAGESTATIERLPDGRLKSKESFRWFTRETSGTNLFGNPMIGRTHWGPEMKPARMYACSGRAARTFHPSEPV